MLKTFLECVNLYPQNIVIDGNLHRCRDTRKGKPNTDGWYSAHQKDDGILLNYGSYYHPQFSESYFFANGTQDTFKSYIPKKVPKSKPAPIANNQDLSLKLWEQFQNFNGNPSKCEYIRKKQINPIGLRAFNNTAAMPILRFSGDGLGMEFSSIQYLNPESKKFAKGSNIKGCFWVLGSLNESTTCVYFSESVGDCYAIYQSFNNPSTVVVNCLNANNITDVVEQFRIRLPKCKFIIAGNNDEAGHKADKASFSFDCLVAYPSDEGEDWSDVYIKNGSDQVQKQLTNAQPTGKPVTSDDLKTIIGKTEIESFKDCERLARRWNDPDSLESLIKKIETWTSNNTFPLHLENKISKLNVLLAKNKKLPQLFLEPSKLKPTNDVAFRQFRSFIAAYFEDSNNKFLNTARLIQGKYLPPDIPLENGDTLCIRSPLGSGKTEYVHSVIELLDKDSTLKARILYITPRITLSKAGAKRLNINDYLEVKEIKNNTNALIAAKRMAATVNSVPSLTQDGFSYDVVIIDECELLISHILGKTVTDKGNLLKHFYALLKNAKRVLVLDAFLGTNTTAMLENAEKQGIKVLSNPIKPWQHISVDWHESIDKMLGNASKQLESSTAIAVVTNSKEKADYVHEALCQKMPEGKVLLVTSDNVHEDAQQAFISDPSEADKYDLIVLSPTVESGVSITSDKFKTVYGFFEPMAEGVGTPLACVQHIGRFRKAEQWYIYCPDKQFDLPTSFEDICHEIALRYHKNCTIASESKDFRGKVTINIGIDFDDPLMQLHARNLQWENQQKQRYAWTLLAIIQNELGCNVHFIPSNSKCAEQIEGKEAKQAAKESLEARTINAVINAPDLDENRYNELKSPDKSKEAKLAKASMDKYEVKTKFCIDPNRDDNEIVKEAVKALLDSGKTLSKVRASEGAIAAFNHSDVTTIASGMVYGWDNDGHNQKEIIDFAHAHPFQNIVRAKALQAIGVTKKNLLNHSHNQTWTNAMLKQSEWYKFCVEHKDNIGASKLGFKVDPEFLKSPSRAFSTLLGSMGINYTREKVTHPPQHKSLVRQGKSWQRPCGADVGVKLRRQRSANFVSCIKNYDPCRHNFTPNQETRGVYAQIKTDILHGNLTKIGDYTIRKQYNVGTATIRTIREQLVIDGLAYKDNKGRIALFELANIDTYTRIRSDVNTGALTDLSVKSLCSTYSVSKETAQLIGKRLLGDGIVRKSKQGKLLPNGYSEWVYRLDFTDAFIIDTVKRRDERNLNVVQAQVQRIRDYQQRQAEKRTQWKEIERNRSRIWLSDLRAQNSVVDGFIGWIESRGGQALTRDAAAFMGVAVDEVLGILDLELGLFDNGVLWFGDVEDCSEDWGQIALII